jgi:DNA modification methylase
LGSRVSFDDARGKPVHGWYHYKEGYSPRLLSLLIGGLDIPPRSTLLDPFAGVGTTIIAAAELKPQVFLRAIGIEYNPFAAFVARTKLRWNEISSHALLEAARRVLAYRPRNLPPVPDSATLRNPAIFSVARLRRLRQLAAGIAAMPAGPTKAALRLALAASLEPSSYAKKDGRALRIIGPGARTASPAELFGSTVRTMASDITTLKNRERQRRRLLRNMPTRGRLESRPLQSAIYQGDARDLRRYVKSRSVGLALYSPPYLNGIDYSEVYKIEEYILGFVKSRAELLKLRAGTLRSHASIRFARRSSPLHDVPANANVRRLIQAIGEFFASHETRPFQRQYSWLVEAYFDDMYEVFTEQMRVLKAGGYSICVVANSMFAGTSIKEISRDGTVTTRVRWQLPLATDVILAALARQAGLEVLPSFAVRTLVPRNIPAGWSRESILVFRKPK